jgi:hypothetical protein
LWTSTLRLLRGRPHLRPRRTGGKIALRETVEQEQSAPVYTPSETTPDLEGHRQERDGDSRAHEFVAGEDVDDMESGDVVSSIAQTSLTTSNDNATDAFSPSFPNLAEITLFDGSDSGVAADWL